MKLLLLNNPGGGGGTPGGSTTQVQFNDGGAFGGDADLVWNKTTNVLGITGDVNLSDGGTYTTTLQTITPTAARTISLPDATGTVALVAGSSGQLLYNNAGVNAGASTLTYDGSILTTSGRFINSYSSVSLAPAKAFTGTWATGFGTTNTKPHLLIEPTGTSSGAWSTSGTGLGVNAASGFAGRLFDFQVNGTSKVHYRANDSTLIVDASLQPQNITGLAGGFSMDNGGIRASAYRFPAGGTVELALERDAANTLAQRNGTAAQTSRVYNTYTSGTNYELGKLEWASNVFRVGTEKGSGGGTARAVEVHTDSISRLALDTTGSVRVVTALTVATLPGTPAVGMVARVTDATAPVVGMTVAGGGAAAALVWYNGTNWSVIGV